MFIWLEELRSFRYSSDWVGKWVTIEILSFPICWRFVSEKKHTFWRVTRCTTLFSYHLLFWALGQTVQGFRMYYFWGEISLLHLADCCQMQSSVWLRAERLFPYLFWRCWVPIVGNDSMHSWVWQWGHHFLVWIFG